MVDEAIAKGAIPAVRIPMPDGSNRWVSGDDIPPEVLNAPETRRLLAEEIMRLLRGGEPSGLAVVCSECGEGSGCPHV